MPQLGDPGIATIAAAQFAVIDVGQLAAVGLGADAVAHRAARGRLHRVHRGVYLVGHTLAPPLATEAAALLACGRDAFLGWHTAGALWEISPADEGAVHVVVVGRDAGRRRGVRPHRVRHLAADDIARRRGLPVTSPGRTLLDLASCLSPRSLERAVDEARVKRLVSEEELRRRASTRGHRGSARLRQLLDRAAGPQFTRSEAEERLLELIRAAQLPPPRVNARVGRYEVDLLWPEAGLVVEIDGYAFHSSRAAFERDRRRDADLQAMGLRVIRVTWRRIADEPLAAIARIAQAVAQGSSEAK